MEDEEVEQVTLYWNDGKKQKSIQDLVFDRQPEDEEILTYYRSTMRVISSFTLVVSLSCICIICHCMLPIFGCVLQNHSLVCRWCLNIQ